MLVLAVLVATLSAQESAGTFSGAAAGQMGGGTKSQRKTKVSKKKAKQPSTEDRALWLRSKTGDTGTLSQEFTTYRVIQLIDDKNALVTAESLVMGTGETFEWHFMLRSSVVADLKEDMKLSKIPGFFKLTGKLKYTAVSGASHTVDLVEDHAKDEKEESRSVKPPPKKTPPPKKAPEFRTWTDASGEHTVEAEYRALVDGIVLLKKKDGGKTIKLPLDKLSEADQKWIKNHAKGR
jgi:hypothetical protein